MALTESTGLGNGGVLVEQTLWEELQPWPVAWAGASPSGDRAREALGGQSGGAGTRPSTDRHVANFLAGVCQVLFLRT